jgi:hypothetical protein
MVLLRVIRARIAHCSLLYFRQNIAHSLRSLLVTPAKVFEPRIPPISLNLGLIAETSFERLVWSLSTS